MSSRHLRLALGLTILAALSFTVATDARAAADPKTVVKCQAALKKQGAKLVAKKLTALAKCTDGVSKCLQTVDETADGGAKRTACVTKARGGCGKALAAITAARQAFGAAVSGACAALDPIQVTGVAGLGFASTDCSAFGTTVTGAADLGACLGAQHECLASRMFQLGVPRTLELIQFTPPPAVAVPAADLASLACLEEQGGSGADLDDLALGKRLLKCEKAIAKAAGKLATGRLKTFEKCVDALFACGQTKTGDALVACRAKARASCVKAFDKQREQSAALVASLAAPCGDPAVFAALRSPAGGNLDALAPGDCAVLTTIADYQACVQRATEALVDDLVRFQAPQAEPLLGSVGCNLGTCGAAPTPTPTTVPNGPTPTGGGVPTPHATVTPGGTCPTTYQLTLKQAGADQDLGYTGAYHDEPVTSNVRLTMGISDCANASTPCGACTLSGPLVNGGGTAFANKRCRGDVSGAEGSWISCTNDTDCVGTGNACVIFAGPPQPLNGFPLCLVTEVAAPIDGTVDLDSGATAIDLVLRVDTFTGVSSFHPCPSCVSGTCSGGERQGQPCTVQGTSIFTGDAVSLDCPPEVAPNPIGFRIYPMRLGTTPTSVTLDATSPTCTNDPTHKCFCQTCNDAAWTPCFRDADCVAVGATTCGGKRCLTGPTIGAPCASSQQCMGTCGVPGDARPNACNDDVCTPNPGDGESVNEGVCLAGPSYQGCAIETLRGCNTNADCHFAGDSCITHQYNCFTDNGVQGSTVSVGGVASTTDPTLSSLFCLPPTKSLAVNALFGLPGLGRVTLPATAVMQ